ncbi:GLUG motif-containing protein [Marinomonas sp.]|uniref:two-partner secretion domain-containing protein n=1 Tax=Marinomonas sp. TaxID=1904862 RepID=UPI003BAD083B
MPSNRNEMLPIGVSNSIAKFLIFTFTMQPVFANDHLPASASVAAGNVSIGSSENVTTVTQHSDKAIVNWDSFSVGKDATVNFLQPNSSSAILNRVTGSMTSTIAGSINANGQVFLINPNGIAITPSGTINVGGGFVGSTLDMTDQDFLTDNFRFLGDGASAAIRNEGVITVGRGGFAALIGGTIKNNGLIAAPLGKVGLGSGEQATLDFSGDGFLQIAMPTEHGAEGNGALIEQQGTISADGGMVLISAASAREAARHAINLSGVVEAKSISGENGAIVIGGGDGGQVDISAQIIATSDDGQGGDITVTGKTINLKDATVDASSAAGGGHIKIGGDYQGKGDTQRADTNHIDENSVIRADATQQGDGGEVIIWSDKLTTFDGLISARGAGKTGKGGDAEVSGKATLSYHGKANLEGEGGFGTLLLDPYNITISNGADQNASGFAATGDDSVINVTTLQNALNSANVMITTGASDSEGAQAGDITVANNVTWNSGSTLTLSAYRDINVNANLTGGTDSNIILRADNSGIGAGVVAFGAGAQATASGGVSIYYNPDDYNSAISYAGNMGAGTTGTAYMLVNTLDNLQAMATNLRGVYALGRDIDATDTLNWNNGAGFAPITNFSGTLDGDHQEISNLYINRPNTDMVGLFGNINFATIRNLGVVDSSVTGKQQVGGLAGYARSTSINNVYFTGAVKAQNTVAGLLGMDDFSVLDNVYTDAKVTSIGAISGGLIAYATGTTLTDVHALGDVAGTNLVGGLIGITTGQAKINNAYATGNVSGGDGAVGGLAGRLIETSISNSYASGHVVGIGSRVGGLIGEISGTKKIINSFWDIDTTQQTLGVAIGDDSGLIGLSSMEARNQANYTGWDFDNVWYQSGDMRPILRSEAPTPNADGVVTISNLHQLALIGTNLNGNYKLIHDVDAANTKEPSAGSIWSQSGFVPLGDKNNHFIGTLNGGDHLVSGLTINESVRENVGLFGYIGTQGTVRNLGLEDGLIIGGYDSYEVGGLAGGSSGTISNVYNTGEVRARAIMSDTGGLIGLLEGGIIESSYFAGKVSAEGRRSFVGGLVGQGYDSTITGSYSSGIVEGRAAVGGLVGISDLIIENSYSNATARTYIDEFVVFAGTAEPNHTGGLVGISAGGEIKHSYASGSISNSDFGGVGGLVGNYMSGTISNSFWNKEVTGQNSSAGSDNSNGLTTAQMMDISTFADWDIDNQAGTGAIWRIYDGYTAPLLRSFMTQLTISGGDVSKTYDGNTSFSGLGDLKYSHSDVDTALIKEKTTEFGYTAKNADVGTYSDSNISMNGDWYSSQQGYDIAIKSGSLTIDKADLTITAKDDSKTYDGVAYSGGNGVSYAGFVTGEDSSAVNLTGLTYQGSSQGAKDAGDYVINASGVTSKNYAITYQAGELKVDQADLTIRANDDSKTYDGVAYSGGNGVSYAGFVTGDDSSAVSLTNLAYQGSSQGAKDAGDYVINASGVTSKNYAITYQTGELEIVSADVSPDNLDTFPKNIDTAPKDLDTNTKDIVVSSASNLGVKSYDGSPFIGDNGAADFSVTNSPKNSVVNTIVFVDTPVIPNNSVVSDVQTSVEIPVFAISESPIEDASISIIEPTVNKALPISTNTVGKTNPTQQGLASVAALPVAISSPSIESIEAIKPINIDSNRSDELSVPLDTIPVLAQAGINSTDDNARNPAVKESLLNIGFAGFLSSSVAGMGLLLLGLAWRRKIAFAGSLAGIALLLLGLVWRRKKGKKKQLQQESI